MLLNPNALKDPEQSWNACIQKSKFFKLKFSKQPFEIRSVVETGATDTNSTKSPYRFVLDADR
jgi:hypothetical protein